MNFLIDNKPPSQSIIDADILRVSEEIRNISKLDTLLTFVLIIITSIVAGVAVFWTTNNYYYAGGAVAVFPILGTALSLMGITKTAGFRSAAEKLGELKNELASLQPVSEHDLKDIEKLCSQHKVVESYQSQVIDEGRRTVNGELAMYWEFDTSTMAKTAKGRDFLEKAKGSVET